MTETQTQGAQRQLPEPTIVTKGPILIAGLERLYDCDNAQDIPKLWNEFGPMFGSIPGQVGYHAFGVSNFMFDGGSRFRYLAACEVSDVAKLPDNFTALRIPAQSYAIFPHGGPVGELGALVSAIWDQWVPKTTHKLTYSPSFVEYYTEDFDPKNQVGNMEVWIPIE